MLSRRLFLPALASPLLAQSKQLRIESVEITQLNGHREDVRGVNHQGQVNPLHVYDELRPRPYRDEAEGRKVSSGVSALYLTIRAGGVDGLYGPIDREAAIVVLEQLKAFLMGKDALAQEALWDQMWRSNRHARRGHFLMAISAVDNTLWDLRGRYFQMPVYRLLGGPTRKSVEAYVSCLGYSLEPDKVGPRAKACEDAGFRYQKWFMGYGPGDGPAGLRKNVELVRILRETLGEGTHLMFDAYMGWDLNYTLEWAKQVEKYHPHWVEEAVHADKPGVFAELRRGTSIPIASGEHIQGRNEVYDYLRQGGLSVVQSDPEWCGGISELQKICTIASVFDVPVIPHGHSIHAALHVVASQSPGTCPLVEYLFLKMESYHHFEKNPPKLDHARFALPDAPGFGIELDPAKIETRKVMVLQ